MNSCAKKSIISTVSILFLYLLFFSSLTSCYHGNTVNLLLNSEKNIIFEPNNPIIPIDFGITKKQRLKISNLPQDKEVFLVKINHNNYSVPKDYTGNIEIPMARNFQENFKQNNFTQRTPNLTIKKHQRAIEFNSNPPSLVKKSKDNGANYNKTFNIVQYGEDAKYSLWNTKQFWVDDENEKWIQITAELKAIGDHCYIWVDQDWLDDEHENKITEEIIENLLKKFEGENDKPSTSIFHNVTNIFGYENGGGLNGDGGIDKDQHISILLYDIFFDSYEGQDNGIIGFFWAKDSYSFTEMNPFDIKSNEMEIFYIDAYFAIKYPDIAVSTLIHEYQHMIHFAEKILKQNLISPTWFNEMCSMNAEDLILENLGLDPKQAGPQVRIKDFYWDYCDSGISDWLPYDEVSKSYATAFTFGAFLSRTYGGAEFYKALMEVRGVADLAITRAIQKTIDIHGKNDTFNDAMRKFAESFIYSNSNTNLATLNKKVVSTINDITYTAQAIEDFEVYPYSNTQFSLRPWGYSVHTRPSWKSNDNYILNINLTAPTKGVEFLLMIR